MALARPYGWAGATVYTGGFRHQLGGATGTQRGWVLEGPGELPG